MKDVVNRGVEGILKQGVIRTSNSPWSSSIIQAIIIQIWKSVNSADMDNRTRLACVVGLGTSLEEEDKGGKKCSHRGLYPGVQTRSDTSS